MLSNYLKIAKRTLFKHWTQTSLNIVGLAVAFGAALLLFLTASFEWSFDNFHQNRQNIYRLVLKEAQAQGTKYGINMPVPMMPNLKMSYPEEIQFATRYKEGSGQIIWNDRVFSKAIQYVDSDFLQMFSFSLLQGSTKTALNELSGVVLSERVAKAVFGPTNAIGKLLTLNLNGNRRSFAVRGIIANAPTNSTLETDVLIRYENEPYYQTDRNDWNFRSHNIFIQLANHVTAQQFEKKLQEFTHRTYINSIESALQNGLQPDEQGEFISIHLNPLKDIHFYQLSEDKHATNPVYPLILSGVSLLIILIAGINFINLTVARSLTRVKEVGIRKSLGATYAQIIGQFWSEAFIVCITGLLLGTVLALSLLSFYNTQFATNLSFTQLLQPVVWGPLVFGFLFITLIAGSYPALIVVQFNTILVLKGQLNNSSKLGRIKGLLVVLQFIMAVLLIISTLIISQQMTFLQNKPLGYNQSQVISIPVGYEVDGYQLLNSIRQSLIGQPQFISVSGADLNLGRGKDGAVHQSQYGFTIQEKKYQTNGLNIDFDYIETLGLQVISGRSFSRKYATDSTQACIVNEAMVRKLNVPTPIGLTIPINGGKTIIGVVKDYNFSSLHTTIEPITMFFNKSFGLSYLFVRIQPNASPIATMVFLEKVFHSVAPKSEFLGTFLDENVNNQYQKERRLSLIFSTATIIAMCLSCMGLFAISLLTIRQRSKEIGIRKVIGASIANITILLAKDFLKLVLIAIIISSPIAYYGMSQWLENFSYKIKIEWYVFILAGLITLSITMLTVSFHSIKAALMNPTKALKTD